MSAALDMPGDFREPRGGGWLCREASLSWEETAGQERSAAELYAMLVGQSPAVNLTSRRPTVALPCRGYAAGETADLVCEVSVQGHDHDVRIRLWRRDAVLPWETLRAMARSLDGTPLGGLPSRSVELEMCCTASSRPAARLNGSGASDPSTVSRWFGESRRQELAAPLAGLLSLERHVVLDSVDHAGRDVLVRTMATVSAHMNGQGTSLPWEHLLERALKAADA